MWTLLLGGIDIWMDSVNIEVVTTGPTVWIAFTMILRDQLEPPQMLQKVPSKETSPFTNSITSRPSGISIPTYCVAGATLCHFDHTNQDRVTKVSSLWSCSNIPPLEIGRGWDMRREKKDELPVPDQS